MKRLFLKDPDAVLDYSVDWSAWLVDGDIIISSDWLPTTGITVVSSSFSTNATTVWVSDGVAGNKYGITNRITTSGGRTDDRTIYIKVVQR